MLTDEQLLSSSTVSGVLAHQVPGLHKSAATLLGVPSEAELKDFVQALGTKLAHQALVQGAIRDGLETYAMLKGAASTGTLPFADRRKLATTMVSGSAAARAARRAAAAHAPAEALAAMRAPAPAASHMRLNTQGGMELLRPDQAAQYAHQGPGRLLELPKSGPAAPVAPKAPEMDIWDQTVPVRRKMRPTEELDLEGLRNHLVSQGYDPQALGFAAPSPKLAALHADLFTALFTETAGEKTAVSAEWVAKHLQQGGLRRPHAEVAKAFAKNRHGKREHISDMLHRFHEGVDARNTFSKQRG